MASDLLAVVGEYVFDLADDGVMLVAGVLVRVVAEGVALDLGEALALVGNRLAVVHEVFAEEDVEALYAVVDAVALVVGEVHVGPNVVDGFEDVGVVEVHAA